MKIWPILSIVLAVLSQTQADIKLLREVNIMGDDSYRHETFSLKNENTAEEELVIEGTHTQNIHPKDNKASSVYRFETIYVADKDGYRVKYKLVRQPNVQLFLSPSTLKSVTG
ncbi:uncharacterized protein LOC135953493 [Calliphora vicina]|uniref:uncharacterized protein LOC135953493 n=1 Tax=Calliphora vicina TaxID=7373 RepID=UPI00325ACE08